MILPEINWRKRDWVCESMLEERRRWVITEMDWGVCWVWVDELKRERALGGGVFTIFGMRVKACWECDIFNGDGISDE